MTELTLDQVKALFNSTDIVIDMEDVEYGYYGEVTVKAVIKYKGVVVGEESRSVTADNYCTCNQY